ncbi:CynX/NimT family MFS transporter [Leifsonia sp. A12D58]|uniref:MFS transporter n=1 Tax=Leifsonia sp. A12D58 TaxID=3397674 RepID=UPI0039DFE102
MIDNPAKALWAGRTLALLGIILVAANLRTAVAALSPIVSDITVDVPLSSSAVGVLGMLPPICFAVFGIFTPRFTRKFGLESVLIVSLIAIGLGHLIRGTSGSLAVLLIGSVVTFAGLGAGNVLLPPLVKKYFPDRVGLITSLYATVLSFSTLVPPLVAVPVAESAGWRVSLGMWSVLALIALVPWITMIMRHRTSSVPTPTADDAEPRVLGNIWRSSIAWAIAIVFAASALNAYAMFAWLPQLLMQTADVTPAQAGLLLSLYAAMGTPCALIIPILTSRMRNVGILVYVGAVCFVLGYLGLILVPATLTWLWVVLAGLGPLLFPLVLVLINLRTRTHDGSVALSGFAQSVGYSIGALGPLVVALLHEVTGGWTWPLIFLIVTALVVAIAGAIISRPHMLEDELHIPT